ncbi:Solitary outer membrane autotransporter beta-barrel domain [Vibrio algicola]|uniref:Solitary outer membrane autotransporter beta-barrel domain n=1 Tax=Vibrio algicola TaxID=2662262 RepID=A0A5Q0TI00_9VIBR|nr:Solitary outer membrane autotransporter beta-barrel domain [Vibrio algicola]
MAHLTTIIAVIVINLTFIALAKASEPVHSRAEQTFSTAVILTNSDVITFGIQDFNPNAITPFQDDNLGDDQSLALRGRVAVTTFPYSWELDGATERFHHQFYVRASYVYFENETKLNQRPDIKADLDINKVYSGYVGYKLTFNITENWRVLYGLGNHFMYYKNKHSYNSSDSESLKPILDGAAYNTSSRAYVAEPNLAFDYKFQRKWGYWRYTTEMNYFYGKSWDKEKRYEAGNPNGWYWMNGVKANYNLSNWAGYIPSMYTSFKRVDLGGDPIASLGTDNYYEFSLGWLLTPPILRDWVDNVGIGININYGSALKGGSIVLFFNQD